MNAYNSHELLTFYLGEALCGLDIARVEELNRPLPMTPVPQAPPYVLGLVNLRGKIITIMDLGSKIGLQPASLTEDSRIIFVQTTNENLGLMVDRVTEVANVDQAQVAAAPANLKGAASRYFEGVLKTDHGLIGILDLSEVVKVESREAAA
jgi:purine-binding chemotaxis protein CheW